MMIYTRLIYFYRSDLAASSKRAPLFQPSLACVTAAAARLRSSVIIKTEADE